MINPLWSHDKQTTSLQFLGKSTTPVFHISIGTSRLYVYVRRRQCFVLVIYCIEECGDQIVTLFFTQITEGQCLWWLPSPLLKRPSFVFIWEVMLLWWIEWPNCLQHYAILLEVTYIVLLAHSYCTLNHLDILEMNLWFCCRNVPMTRKQQYRFCSIENRLPSAKLQLFVYHKSWQTIIEFTLRI